MSSMHHHPAGSRLVAAALVPLLLLGCTGGSSGSSGTASQGADGPGAQSVDYTEAPAAAAARLAAAISAADSLEALLPLAREALARTGVPTLAADEAVVVATGPRQAGLPLYASQVDTLVRDHLEGQGWTLADLTRAIAEHPDGPGEALLERPTTIGRLLRAWAEVAARAPEDPEAFAPLLLAGLAQARGGTADYTTGSIKPTQVPLSTLELAILTAGVSAGTGTAPDASASGIAAGRGMAARPVGIPAILPAGDKGPCAALEEALGKEAQDFLEEGSGGLFDQAMDKVKDWLGTKGDGALGKGLGNAAGVLKIANLLTSMMAMYGGYSLTLTWDPSNPHYLGYDGGHGDPKMTVTANVSTRPQADDATLACLKFLGIEKPDSESVKDTTVQWIPLRGTPKHATVTSKDLTRMAVSEQGKATLELAMTAEKSTEAGKTGKLKKGQIVIQADLTTYKATPSKIAAAAVFGGTLGGSIEAGKGWFNSWFPKRAVATIPVEWHQLPVWWGSAERPDGTAWVFESGQGAKSIWKVTLTGGPIQAGPISFTPTGKGAFDLTSGSASTTFTREATGTMLGYTVKMTTQLPMSIELTGTDEAPTLTVTSSGGTNIVTGGGQAVQKSVEPGGTTVVTLQEVPDE